MNKPKIECIYLDMDGVIADFVKRYKEMYNMHPDEAEGKKKFNDYFGNFIATKQFSTLDMMPGAQMGLDFLKSCNVPTQILSSTANEDHYFAISKQKSIWLQTHGLTFNSIFVPGKHLKYKYASPTRIIIDDTESVIDDWDRAGGIGILHHDWLTTISILKLYV